jgi:predicted dienelactone hydrolase
MTMTMQFTLLCGMLRGVRRGSATAAGLALMIFAVAAGADSLAVVDPLPPGPYVVGCSNVEQDFSRVLPGETAKNYWEGVPDGSRQRYVTQLLVDPVDALTVNVNVPDDRELFVNHATQQVPTALLVCYPTASNNPRPDYPLPESNAVPHMQRGAEAPIWADPGVRWPVMVFSHGLVGSPLSNDYIVALTVLASYGYVVVAPFHGDPRFADVKIDNLSDALYAALHFPTYVEMQAIRPLSAAAALDFLLGHLQYRDHVDASRIVGFGASLGAETLLLQAGAQLTKTIGLSSKQVVADTRLKAIVGYVPYFGQSFLPAFGRDQKGLDNFTTPFLGIAGFADTTAPIDATIQGVLRLHGSRELLGLEGVGHFFDFPSAPDIFTWSVIFFAAHAQDDRTARAQIARMVSVRGGGDDRLIIDYTAPAALSAGERDTIEFYATSLKHYFETAEPAEAAMLDAGIIVPGWVRTGFDFKSWTVESGIGVPACRFFGTPGSGPNTHVFSINVAECNKLRADSRWTFEGLAFDEQVPIAEDCPIGRIPVTRLYNNGMGGEANHRYLTSHSEIHATAAAGWLVEGVVFCAPP